MKRLSGTQGQRQPTVAPMAGTTLGLINVPGLPLGPKHRAFDTPGVPHTHQLTSLLSFEEIKQVGGWAPGPGARRLTELASRVHD